MNICKKCRWFKNIELTDNWEWWKCDKQIPEKARKLWGVCSNSIFVDFFNEEYSEDMLVMMSGTEWMHGGSCDFYIHESFGCIKWEDK